MNRFTAEHRGGDRGEKPWEWCVVDEEEGLFGSAIVFGLTEEEANALAKQMNEESADE